MTSTLVIKKIKKTIVTICWMVVTIKQNSFMKNKYSSKTRMTFKTEEKCLVFVHLPFVIKEYYTTR